jgi:hypothetical protein
MKTNTTPHNTPRGRFTRSRLIPLRAIAAAALLLGGLGVATSRADILYAGSFNSNTIEKFTPGGSASQFANSGLNSPTFLAFTNDAGVPLQLTNQQVPEPATWAMLCGGIGMLIGFKRFARRSKP